MQPTPSIVVGVDHSDPSRRALRFAATEAERRSARLEVVWAWDGARPSGGPDVPDGSGGTVELHAWAQRELTALVTDVLGETDETMELRAVADAAADALLRSGRHADLLVVGARGGGGFAGLRLGSVSLRVAAQATCPVVIVPAASTDLQESDTQRIAVGVDGSDTARAALGWALEAAALRHASVVAEHGWGPPPAPSPQFAPLAAATDAIGRRAALITDAAVEWAAERAPGVPVTTRSVPSSGASALVAASSDASLVVVGSRGLGRLAGALLGSVAQQVAGHASCPVVVVPAGWHAEHAEQGEHGDRRRAPADASATPADVGGRVVVGIDSEASTEGHVLAAAADEARQRGALLDVVSVWSYPPMSSEERMMVTAEQVGDEAQRRAARQVTDALGPEGERDLDVRLSVLRAAPVTALLDGARGSELLVVGRRDKSRVRHLLLGSVADQCVRHATCPTMIVPHVEDSDSWDGPIVVGVDGSTNSLRALEWAGRTAALQQRPLVALSVWAVPVLDPYAATAGAPDVARTEADALELLDRWIAGAVPDHTMVTPRVRWGSPARAILDEAANASMVVVGARGRGGFASLLLGSASREVVHRAPCPVVVLPSSPDARPTD